MAYKLTRFQVSKRFRRLAKHPELVADVTMPSFCRRGKETPRNFFKFLEQHGREMKSFTIPVCHPNSGSETCLSKVFETATNLRRLTLLPDYSGLISDITEMLLDRDLMPNPEELNLKLHVDAESLAQLCARRLVALLLLEALNMGLLDPEISRSSVMAIGRMGHV